MTKPNKKEMPVTGKLDIVLTHDGPARKLFEARTEWVTKDGNSCKTYGCSAVSHAEAIGNMIAQLAASKDHFITVKWINNDGTETQQPKM